MKSTASRPRKAKDRENDQSYGLDTNQGFFCGASFLRLVAPNEMMPHMSKDHKSWATYDGNHVMVLNPSEMIFITSLVTKTNTRMPKPRSANERLDPQHGEAQHQMKLPQSFVVTNIIPNPIRASTSGGMSKKTPSFILRSKAPPSLMGAAKVMC